MRTVACLLVLASGGIILLAGGCSTVDPLTPTDVAGFQTLTVAYGDPGLNAGPCDDALPIIDGVGTEAEWSSAEPLLVQMSGANGNGGADFFLEVRAIWTDEGSKFGAGSGAKDRIYFLIRYTDQTLDRLPDLLAYGTVHPITGQIVPSPAVPEVFDCTGADTIDTMKPQNWTHLNREGQEDQVMVLLTRVDDPTQPSGLVETNGYLMQDYVESSMRLLLGPGGVGVGRPAWVFEGSYQPPRAAGREIDVWIWRAGRTNLHPVFQFPNWGKVDDDESLPEKAHTRFEFKTGFAEDLWIDSSGRFQQDAGRAPYVINYNLDPDNPIRNTYPIPLRLHGCPAGDREPSEDELGEVNAGLPNDQALWDGGAPQPRGSQAMKCGAGKNKNLACGRVGAPDNWSTSLSFGEFDFVQGWKLRVPFDHARPNDKSARDIRARGTYETTQERGFPVRTVEIMRDFDTDNDDDLPIVLFETNDQGQKVMIPEPIFRIVIGVFDHSGTVGSGSTEIFLRFQPPTPRAGLVDRC